MFKVEKDFEHNGHRCVVIFTDMGHRCGYVGVNESSPLWCKDYCDYLPINKSELEGEEIGKRGVFPLMMAALYMVELHSLVVEERQNIQQKVIYIDLVLIALIVMTEQMLIN